MGRTDGIPVAVMIERLKTCSRRRAAEKDRLESVIGRGRSRYAHSSIYSFNSSVYLFLKPFLGPFDWVAICTLFFITKTDVK